MGKIEKQLRLTNQLHVWRARRRMTQVQLATAVEVTRGTILAIEKGDYNPSLELAFRLAVFFGCGLEDIFQVAQESKEEFREKLRENISMA